MLKMIFQPEDPSYFELVLAAYGYKQCWEEQGQKIIDKYLELTGLQFQQKQITAIIVTGDSSSAGKTGVHMKLSNEYHTPDSKLANLMHELAHRLLGGNKIWTDDDSNIWRYDEHRRIYLFLYDAWLELYGEKFADAALERDRRGPDYYNKAWNSVLKLSTQERRASFKRLMRK